MLRCYLFIFCIGTERIVDVSIEPLRLPFAVLCESGEGICAGEIEGRLVGIEVLPPVYRLVKHMRSVGQPTYSASMSALLICSLTA